MASRPGLGYTTADALDMTNQDPPVEADELTEDLVLALPAHRWGNWWFGALLPTPVTIHFDPAQLRFRFTDAAGRPLPTDRCETLGGAQVVAAKDRLIHVHSTRQNITERLHRRQASAHATPPPPPAPASAPAPAVTRAPTASSFQQVIAPFSEPLAAASESLPATVRTSSVFKRRNTKAVDIIARVKNTDRINKAERRNEVPDPFGRD